MAFFITGCGTSESEKAYDKFEKITLGTTFEDAKKKLGDDYLEIGKNTYQWSIEDGTIILDFNKGKVISKSQINLKTVETNLKPEIYNKIKPGMTYEEVKKIIGNDGAPSGETKHKDQTVTTYTWNGDKPDMYIQISFMNDRVVTITKRGIE